MRKFVFKSSAHYYGCERDDPAFFTEEMQRPHPPRTRLERDIVEAENAVRAFADAQRRTSPSPCCASPTASGPDLRTSHTALFSLPAVPSILGFDPRYQFIHEDDIVGVLEHAVREDLPGHLQRAPATACSCSRRSRACSASRSLPLLPPWGTGLAAGPLRLAGLRIPPEMLQPAALRPRARQPQAQGRRLRASATRRARRSQAFAEHLRLRRPARGDGQPYRYEREVEEFLRWSPSVRRGSDAPANLQG